MASNSWLSAGGTKHKGALHRALGVKEGTPMTAKTLNAGFKAINERPRNQRMATALKSSNKPTMKG